MNSRIIDKVRAILRKMRNRDGKRNDGEPQKQEALGDPSVTIVPGLPTASESETLDNKEPVISPNPPSSVLSPEPILKTGQTWDAQIGECWPNDPISEGVELPNCSSSGFEVTAASLIPPLEQRTVAPIESNPAAPVLFGSNEAGPVNHDFVMIAVDLAIHVAQCDRDVRESECAVIRRWVSHRLSDHPGNERESKLSEIDRLLGSARVQKVNINVTERTEQLRTLGQNVKLYEVAELCMKVLMADDYGEPHEFFEVGRILERAGLPPMECNEMINDALQHVKVGSPPSNLT